MTRLRGAIAAAVTPMRPGGAAIDERAVAVLVRFLADGGLDGVLVAGTTGEGVLLDPAERMRLTELFLEARPDRDFLVAVHAGAQSTDHTTAMAAHARDAGADAVAVIAPPYFPLDEQELLRHLASAAEASAPLPFYVYEFEARSGYRIPVEVIGSLGRSATNLAGLKVSDTPLEAVSPYLATGLDVFVGSEPLVADALGLGAVGAVSGLATAWPEVVAELVRTPESDAHRTVVRLRAELATLPFHAALKGVLVARGILTHADVRAPLRGLTEEERARVRALLAATVQAEKEAGPQYGTSSGHPGGSAPAQIRDASRA